MDNPFPNMQGYSLPQRGQHAERTPQLEAWLVKGICGMAPPSLHFFLFEMQLGQRLLLECGHKGLKQLGRHSTG